MREPANRDLRTIMVAVVAAAVAGAAVPAVGAMVGAETAGRVDGGGRASIGPGKSVVNGFGCDPTTTQYVSCGSLRLNLPRRGPVLLTMDGAWDTTTAPSLGRCRFFGPGTSNEQVNFGEPADSATDHHFGFNEVTKRVARGGRTFGFECREFTGDTIVFKEIMMSAVYVGQR